MMRLSAKTRATLLAWGALLALLALTCGLSYVDLGWGNLAMGLGIAACKIAIVAWLFMRLNHSHALVRVAATLAFVALTLLFVLSSVDTANRQAPAAGYQAPEQIGARLSH
jgi:caa(3)-type oxidase subunit IV